jgi:cell division septation protein DedD
MVKYLFIFINSISLFLYSLFSGDGGISITNNFPASIKPGETVKVEVRIVKGGMSGFAKMQLELPAGISVDEMDSKGANFSYVEGTAKWVWATLPTENEIVLKLALVADPAATPGKTIISGKYSFVENNAKQVVEMNPVEITIGDGAVTTTNTDNTNPQNNAAQTQTTAADNSTVTTPTETTAGNNTSGNREPDGNITVQRTITKGSTEGEYIISLKVNKGPTKGFARYSDDLPNDLAARAGKTEGASFSVADGKVKFVWVAVPEKDILELSYTLSGINKPVTLNGEYSYLEQNQSKKHDLQPETITPDAQNIANNTNTSTPTETTSTETNTTAVTDNSATTNTTSANTESAVTTPTKSATTEPNETITKKDGNVNYHVQIGAFTNSQVTTARLKKKFGISETIQSEFHAGFSKFMVGMHSEYKSARDHREKVKTSNRVASAFVVAYNTGKRITVQEALMITNQKWFK